MPFPHLDCNNSHWNERTQIRLYPQLQIRFRIQGETLFWPKSEWRISSNEQRVICGSVSHWIVQRIRKSVNHNFPFWDLRRDFLPTLQPNVQDWETHLCCLILLVAKTFFEVSNYYIVCTLQAQIPKKFHP